MKEFFYDFFGLNSELFLLINHFCHEFGLQKPLYLVTKIFDLEIFGALYVAGIIIGYVILFNKKAILSKYYDLMAKLGISYTIFGFLFAGLKFSANLQRPFCSAEMFYTILDIALERCESSFPSSHSGLALLLLFSLWPYLHDRIWGKLLLIFLFIITALSRIALAMHYPADILYSMVATCLVILVSNQIYKLFKDNIIGWVKKKLI